MVTKVIDSVTKSDLSFGNNSAKNMVSILKVFWRSILQMFKEKTEKMSFSIKLTMTIMFQDQS